MNVIRLVGDHSHQSAKLGDFTAIIPYPDLPEGWEHTNEFREPTHGDYFYLLVGKRIVSRDYFYSFAGDGAYWIVKRKVEYCPTCGQKKG